MEMYISVDKNTISQLFLENDVFVLMLKQSRIKAKQIAIYEVLFALSQYKVKFITNGPLGDVKGVLSFAVEKGHTETELNECFSHLGYIDKIYKIIPCSASPKQKEIKSINDYVWKGQPFDVIFVFEQDKNLYGLQSSHNREFIILDEYNKEKIVAGYRGDGSIMGRRALPVEDCRCMVNLGMLRNPKTVIDPFAGAGGILFQAKYINPSMQRYSVDIDPIVSPGLKRLSKDHYIGNAKDACFNNVKFDAIITEVPFFNDATNDVLLSIKNLKDYLSNEAMIVIMNSIEQQEFIYPELINMHFYEIFSKELNRKGTDVVINCFTNNEIIANDLTTLSNRIKTIY